MSPVLRRAVALAALLLLVLPNAVFGAVSTDQADYSPGSIVTISGSSDESRTYIPGNTVAVAVVGPASASYPDGWTAECSATVADGGVWSCQITLDPDPAVAVGNYAYTATQKDADGNIASTEQGTFTDNVAISIATPAENSGTVFKTVSGAIDVQVAGKYTCTTTGTACHGAQIKLSIRADDGTNNSFTGTAIVTDQVVGNFGTGTNQDWSYKFEFRTVAGSGQYPIPADGLYEIQATLYRLTTSSDTTYDTLAGTALNDKAFAVDNTAPAPPTLSSSTPPSGSDNTSPKINGTAEAGSTVRLYTNNDCTSSIAGSDVTTNPGSFAAEVTVADGSTTTFWGTATDPAGNTSACSTSSFTYVEFAPPVNAPPTVDAGGPYEGDEGEAVSISGTASDLDLDPLTTKWTYVVDSADAGTTCAFGDDTALSTTITCTDDGTFTLTLTATGDPDGPVSDTASLTLDNVAPQAAANATPFVYDHFTGVAKAKFDFADDGTNDSHTATFTWSQGTPGSPSVSETKGAGTATGTATFAPGCYTITVTGHATDDNLADSNEQPIVADYQVDVYSVQFLAPIKDNERNFAKYGNVLPVKVKVTSSCTGLSVLSDSLYVSYVKGTGGEIIEGTETIGETVSSADGSGGQMRTADEFYIYNFTTKPLTANTDYTLRIRVGNATTGPIILAAVVQLKK